MQKHAINDLYNRRYDFQEVSGAPAKTLMIASIPRTGSTLFAVELWRRGVFGSPMEYINLHNRMQDMVPRLGGNPVDYWANLQRFRTGPNGVFSFKAFASDFAKFGSKYQELLPYVQWDEAVYLTRRDKLGQALSYARAYQTRRWFAQAKDECEPRYDKSAIDMALRWIDKWTRAWETIFDIKGIEPLRIEYEDFIADEDRTINKVAGLLGVDPAAYVDLDLPRLELQSDEISEAWRSRYIKEGDNDFSVAASLSGHRLRGSGAKSRRKIVDSAVT